MIDIARLSGYAALRCGGGSLLGAGLVGILVWCWQEDRRVQSASEAPVQAVSLNGPRSIPPVRLDFSSYPSSVAVASPAFERSHKRALEFAIRQFQSRGGSYEFGPNDCSTFVSDYLEGLGAPLRTRLTTKLMMDPGLTQSVGLQPVLTSPKVGDILVFRYRNAQGETRGHCGVLTKRGGDLLVKHNSLRHGGVVEEPYESFKRFFKASGRLEQFATLRLVN